MNGKRVTLQDIAEATGFTVNTVSRALKNKSDISKETCAQIQQVASEMGYVRNYMASSLRSGRTKTLAMIAGTMSNPYYALLADEIQREASRLGYSLMILCSRENPETELQCVEMALSRLADGVLLFPSPDAGASIDRLYAANVPFVLMGRYMGPQYDSVTCDEEMGGYLAGKHLLEQGHRKIAMFASYNVAFSHEMRLKGFTRACREAGMAEDAILNSVCMDNDMMLDTLLSWRAQGVTGLFAFCDVEAWNAITLLENRGFRVPGDMSIVGFDNIQGMMNFPKPICSVDGDMREMARAGIDLIRTRIHDVTLAPRNVTTPVSMVCRKSCH